MYQHDFSPDDDAPVVGGEVVGVEMGPNGAYAVISFTLTPDEEIDRLERSRVLLRALWEYVVPDIQIARRIMRDQPDHAIMRSVEYAVTVLVRPIIAAALNNMSWEQLEETYNRFLASCEEQRQEERNGNA